ncbi:MAG: hypothetical protein RJA07_2387 [Bacteroidota bacterium]|jgi:hypothetical protein
MNQQIISNSQAFIENAERKVYLLSMLSKLYWEPYRIAWIPKLLRHTIQTLEAIIERKELNKEDTQRACMLLDVYKELRNDNLRNSIY